MKIKWVSFWTIFYVLASQTMSFLAPKKMKNDISKQKFGNRFGDVVSYTMAHICAEYENFITNYDTIMAILMPTLPCQDRALKVFDSSLTAPLARGSRRCPLSCV